MLYSGYYANCFTPFTTIKVILLKSLSVSTHFQLIFASQRNEFISAKFEIYLAGEQWFSVIDVLT